MDPGELRRIAILADLPDERLRELAQHGVEQTYRAGEYVFRGHEEAVHWWLLLEGELETTIDVAGDELPLLHHQAGGFLGAISILTGELLRGSTRAAVDSRLFLVEPDAFRRLLVTEPTVFKAVMDVFIPVITNYTAMERDRDGLLSLGTLAAGLAHELNNPAAAAQRGGFQLEVADVAGRRALSGLAAHGVGADAIARLCQLTSEALGEADEEEPLAGLDRADRVATVTSWLAARGVENGVAAADALVDAGLDEAWVERLLAVAPDSQEELLAWVASRLTTGRITHELEDATARISQLVQSVRQYSYLDQAPRQEVDIHEGLESTLAILSHKVSEQDRDRPRVRRLAAADRRARARAEPGVDEPHRQRPRRRSGGRSRDDPNAARGRLPRRRGGGRRPRHSRRRGRTHLRPVLHHETAGRGYRPRSRHRPEDRRASPRRPAAEAHGPRRLLPGAAAVADELAVFRLEVERERVDAVAQAGRLRAVEEDVAEVGAAGRAPHLRTAHAVAQVFLRLDGLLTQWREGSASRTPSRTSSPS